jgi:hypothetical protein
MAIGMDKRLREDGCSDFDPHTGARQHIDQRIDAEEIDLPSHQVTHARLTHLKQRRRRRLGRFPILQYLPKRRH